MKLISLSCDQDSFKTLKFNPSGITFILGDTNKNTNNKDASSNGVGKTLALGLVHHCLGATPDKVLSAVIPDWLFTLTFEHNRTVFKISRSGDGKKIFINGEATKPKKYLEWLNQQDFFYINNGENKGLTFRSLYKRFSRYLREDCLDPVQLYKESDYDALLRTSFLLGLDVSLIYSKKNNKTEVEKINHYIKNWNNDPILKELIASGNQPKLRNQWLTNEIERLTSDLENFQIAENYRTLETEANLLTQKIREFQKQEASLNFQIENIEKSIKDHPDITREDLLDLYNGLQNIFRPETLEHFEKVETFHNSLAINRKNRLLRDKIQLVREKNEISNEIRVLSIRRDENLKFLNGKKAIDEYTSVVNKLASFKEEKSRIEEFLSVVEKQQYQVQLIKERKVEEDRLAYEYAANQPLNEFNNAFTSLVDELYPHLPAGIILDNNTGDNQIRYNLTVHVQSDSSDGVNSARIICFDWLLLIMGANHKIEHLWHDNRLFADMDALPRANWFKYVNLRSKLLNVQYIASLNYENYESMYSYLDENEKIAFEKLVTLRLIGDKPENKLLGIQYGKKVSLIS